MNKDESKTLYEDCQDCGKLLNEMEIKFCEQKEKETGQITALCSACLNKRGGEWPAVDLSK